MRHHNSQSIRFYTDTLVSIYLDLVSAILPQNEIARDVDTIRARALNEGMSFFTKALPKLGKSIDVSLAHGTGLEDRHGFQKKRGGVLPHFMNGLFRAVFRNDGVPWFATWHSNLQQHLQLAELVVDDPEGSIQISQGSVKLPYFDLLQKQAKQKWPAAPDDVLRSWMKNLAMDATTLQKLVGPFWADHIMLGEDETGPHLSNEMLSSRREAQAVALRAMRQVCFCFYKLELPYTHEQESRVLEDFVQVDEALDYNVERLCWQSGAVYKTARNIIARILCNANPLSGLPRHGPGSVATGEKSPEKHIFTRDYKRLTAVFGLDEWFFCNLSHVCDSYQELQALETLEYGTAKVVLVPKDSRGPRLISCEPLEYQWIQQSLMRVLVDTLETHDLTAGRLNFRDQTVNRELALASSRSFKWVTLDMKEASDRVSLELVKSLFPAEWYRALYASRSAATRLPNGDIVQLKKFAPMGSAVCFPVEALIFWALSVATLIIHGKLPLRIAATKVYVYGDDIICDANYHGIISNTLPQFGIMLNQDKCCTAGPFKESCGMDAFYGYPVTPLRIKSVWCERPEPSMVASYVEYSNELYRRNLFESAFHLEREIQWLFRAARMSAIPTVSGGNPSCIAFVRQHERPIPKNRSLGCKIRTARRDPRKPNYQVFEVQGYRLETTSSMTKSYGWPFLLRKLTEMEAKHQHLSLDRPGACSLRTGQYPIAHRVRLKRAWTPLH